MKVLTYITIIASSLLLVGILRQIVFIRRKLPSLAWTLITWAFILFVWRRAVTVVVLWSSIVPSAFLFGGEMTTLLGMVLFLIGLMILNDVLGRVEIEAKRNSQSS